MEEVERVVAEKAFLHVFLREGPAAGPKKKKYLPMFIIQSFNTNSRRRRARNLLVLSYFPCF
jgi:hypothetical protein